jgi:hypothetical protein
MTPRDLLAAVLPPSGRYVAVAIGKKGAPKQTFHTDVDSLLSASAATDAAGVNAYYALASFGTANNRTKENAVALRCAFLDVDTGEGKPFKTIKDAQYGLAHFLQDAGLPMPLVVTSGYGLHVYWAFTQEQPVATWHAMALQLKALCVKHSFDVDQSVIADAARVLRVPGTHNFKNPADPKGVRILSSAAPGPIGFEDFCKALGVPAPAPRALALPLSGTPLAPRASTLLLVENTLTSFAKITKASPGCAQIQFYVDHAADEGMEPLWRGLLSWTKYCVDGEKMAKGLSSLHPYDEVRMQSKLDSIKGPYSCVSMNGANPGVCDTCPHRGKITNPLALGVYIPSPKALPPPIPERRESVSPESVSVEADLAKEVMPLPHGFSFGANGGVLRVVRETQPDGSVNERVVPILPYTLAVAAVRDQDNGSSVHLFADMKGGRKEFVIPSNTIMSKQETLKALAEQGVFSMHGQETDNALHAYLRSVVTEYTYSRATQQVPDTYGWQKDGTFVLNNICYQPSGSPLRVAASSDLLNLNEITRPTGTLAKWRNAVEMFVAKEKYDVLFGLTTAFGAPLMELVGKGLNGLVIHLQSRETGTGKSVSLSLASSVYGHPQRYGVSVNTSEIATYHRMGSLHSLPLVMDEVTNRMREAKSGDPEWITRLLMDITTGKGKERLEASTITERRNVTTWATLALLSSNTSILDALGSRNYTTKGEMMRMLEVGMHNALELSPSEVKVLESLNENYGVAGAQYIRWLVQNKQRACLVFDGVKEQLAKAGGFSANERFWLNGLSAMLTGATLAKEAGVVDLPVAKLGALAVELVQQARREAKHAEVDAQEQFSRFINENYGKMVVVRREESQTRVNLGLSEIVDETQARGAVVGRIEIGYRKGLVSVFIDRKELGSFCSKVSYSSSEMLRHLKNEGFIVTPETRKGLFVDTRIKVGTYSKVSEITMSEARFNELVAPNP